MSTGGQGLSRARPDLRTHRVARALPRPVAHVEGKGLAFDRFPMCGRLRRSEQEKQEKLQRERESERKKKEPRLASSLSLSPATLKSRQPPERKRSLLALTQL